MENFIRKINIDDFAYSLPGNRIAQYPVKERDKSRLLVYRNGVIETAFFSSIPDHLPSDSLIVFNNTSVIRARLLFTKNTGSIIEILLLEPSDPVSYEQTFVSRHPVEWKCIIGNLKKWKKGLLSFSFKINGNMYELIALRTGRAGEASIVRFSWEPDDITFIEMIGSAGHIPLPPYLNREDEEDDYIRYQTVYGRINGSVAAPTAGLHFTEKVLSDILNKGIRTSEITLHIGAGTFQPVRSLNIRDHVMHREHFSVSRETIKDLLSFLGRIIAVGTTTVRTLESLYWLGVKTLRYPDSWNTCFFTGQWEPYQGRDDISVQESLASLLKTMEKDEITVLHASTEILIIPGYKFRMIKGMVTNFHQPGSTLLLLVSAFIGDEWKRLYNFALENGFRFLSYGDSSLLIK